MPFSINFFGEKFLVKHNFQTQQILSSLILNNHQTNSNFNLGTKFSDIMKNIIESSDLGMKSKIKEIQTGCIIDAKGHQVIENLKKKIMSSGISLDKLIVDDQTLTALINFLVDAGFDEEEVISCTDACKTVNNKSELRLSDVFASFSELRQPISDKEQEHLLDISVLPHIESILSRLSVDPAKINNVMTDATIEGKGINIDLLVSNLKKIIGNSPESKSLFLNPKDQNEIEEIINPIGFQNKIFTDGSITLEELIAELETLLAQKSDSLQSSRFLSRDLDTFLKNIKIDTKVKEYSVIPGLVETIPGIETSDIEESKWFHFQLNKEKIESNTIKSFLFDRLVQSDSRQLQPAQKPIAVSKTASAMGTSILKKSRQFDFKEKHLEIESPPRKYIMNQLAEEERIRGVQDIFKAGENFEYLNATNIGSETSPGVLRTNRVEDKLNGNGMDRRGDLEQVGDEISLTKKIPEIISNPLTLGIKGEIDFGISKVAAKSIPVNFLSDNQLGGVREIEKFTVVPEIKLEDKQLPIYIIDPINKHIFRDVSKSQNEGSFDPKPAISEDLRLTNDGKYASAKNEILVSKMIKATEESNLKENKNVDSKINYAGAESDSVNDLNNNWIKEEQIEDVKAILALGRRMEHLNTKSELTDRRVDAREAIDENFLALNIKNKSLVPISQPEIVENVDFDTSKTTTQIFSSEIPVNMISDTRKSTNIKEQNFWDETLAADIIDQVNEKILRSIHKAKNEINLELKPAGLGRLQLHIENDDDTIKVRILAEHQFAKEILVAHVGDLKAALMEQGLCLESCDILASYNFDQSLANSRQESNKSNDRRRKEINDKDCETGISLDRISEAARRNKTTLDLVA